MPLDPQVLASLPLLAGATPEEVGEVAALMEPGQAEPGEVLGRQGEPGETFWLVLAGQVAITGRRPGHTERHLADAGPGSILGELALLRHQARTATVTAATPCTFAVGREDALCCLLAIEAVRRRVQLLASMRLAEDLAPVKATLRDGTDILVRPLLPHDRDALDQALRKLSQDSIRRRFFSVARPPAVLIDHLVNIDYVDHFAWAVLDAGTRAGIATARYVRGVDRRQAEMAFTVADAHQGRGLGTFLLGAIGVAAAEAGVEHLVAYVMEENRPMRRVFAKAGGRARFDEPGLLLVTVEPERAAALLAAEDRERLAGAVHDIVTAASLALRA